MKILKSNTEIEEALNKEFILILAKTHTCSACKTIEALLKQNVNNIDQIETSAIFVDDNDEFRGKHLIFSVPTVLIFNRGKELLRESRYINYDKITRLIKMFKD
ncbi:MAG: thioredoxin family protein [Candidatus Izimaplasma sp.]|nr:thioredoxin family protein [Candidatus Izimaplasma bacterium]